MGGPFGQPIGGLKGSLNINFGSDGVYCKKIDWHRRFLPAKRRFLAAKRRFPPTGVFGSKKYKPIN